MVQGKYIWFIVRVCMLLVAVFFVMTTSHFSVVSQVFGDFLVFEAELHDLIMAMEFALEHSWNNFGLRVILEASFKLSGTLILFLIVQAFMATLLMVLFGGRLRSFIREDFRINFVCLIIDFLMLHLLFIFVICVCLF